MCILHLYYQIQQYAGLAPGHRVFGLAPKILIGAVGNPHFNDFICHKSPPHVAQSQDSIAGIRRLDQSSLQCCFEAQFTLTLNRRFGGLRNGGILSGETVCFLSTDMGDMADRKCLGPGIIVWRSGDKHALVHYMGNFLDVDAEHNRPTGKILGVLGFVGKLQLHPQIQNPHYVI